MRRFIAILGSAVLAILAAWPALAQDGRREHHGVWIGAMCVPIDGALRAQLQIDDGVGLVVAEIVPESPAAAAGLKRFDVITGIDGKPLQNVGELMTAVAAADQSLKLDLFRGGKKQTLEVKPDVRPRGDVLRRFNVPFNEGRDPPQTPEAMREWIKKMQQNLPEGEAKRMQEWMERVGQGEALPFRMQVFGPGIVMHRAGGGEPLPKGVSATIKKSGDKLAEIHVERGDEKWDVKENELDQLPPELRGPIGAMLGGGAGAAMMAVPGGAAGGIAIGSADAGIGIGVEPDVRMKTRTFTIPPPPHDGIRAADLEAMKKQLEQLRLQVEELQKLQGAAPPKEPTTKKNSKT